MKKLMIGLIRVSTEGQGVAGNGLEAQRLAIEKFAEDTGYTLLEIVREEVSGKLGLEDRPVMKAALEKAIKLKAVLVVSKLDRLSRNAAFILNLMQTKAKFAVAQFGLEADPFMLHMYAVLGEKERAMIGARTKDALAIRIAKGVKLGNRTNIEYAREKAAKAVSEKADAFAARMRVTIERMLGTGMSYRAIAAELNENGVKTARDGIWTPTTISRMVSRWEA